MRPIPDRIPAGPAAPSSCARRSLEPQRDEPLLRAVVQIPLDPPARLVRCGDDPGARRGELSRGLRVRHGDGDELGEGLQALLGAGGEALVPRLDGERAPRPPADDDRDGQRRPDPHLADLLGERAADLAVGRRDRPAGRWPARSRGRSVARASSGSPRPRGPDRAPGTGDDRHHAVRIEPDDHRGDGSEHARDLGPDRGYDLRRGRVAGDEGRDPPQGGLVLEQLGDLGAALGVRDRGGDELGEVGDLRLGARRERALALRRGRDHAPHAARDHDRAADRRTDPQLPRLPRDRARGVREAVHAGRAARLPHLPRDAQALQAEPRADCQLDRARGSRPRRPSRSRPPRSAPDAPRRRGRARRPPG